MLKTSKIVNPILCISAVITAMALSSGAFAGYKNTPTTSVYINTTSFSGAYSDARNSTNTTEYLYCAVNAGTGTLTGSCQARDASGKTAGCYTYDTGMMDLIKHVGDSTRISVIFNTSGQCTSISAMNGSQIQPKSL